MEASGGARARTWVSADSGDWVVVLAAGDGRRLRSLTTDERGVAVPKQFCSLTGGQTLLEETLDRALEITDPDHVVVIVAENHRQWWHPLQGLLPDANIVVQPRNRGTANGIILPVLHVLDRDPAARVLIMPSDHYIREEHLLVHGMRRALRQLDGAPDQVVLLGITPDEADPELGYIQPGAATDQGLYTVASFVEKPPLPMATGLLQAGSVWNSFIMAAEAETLLDLFAGSYPEVVMAMVEAVRADRRRAGPHLQHLYENLPDIDFSRHVITGAEHRLRMLPIPACGWSDLGTPDRVARTLQQLPRRPHRALRPRLPFINLAAAQHRLQATA